MPGAVAADVVVDVNGNMVTASDHNYTSMVPLAQDTRSKQSLIKVINIFYHLELFSKLY